jgi:cbb3-type cytochrome oxidase maturation protein
MAVLAFLIPIAIAMVALALVAFRWASRSGQFDDLETPAVRILFEDDPRSTKSGIRNNSL